jgi:hypothetical protein
VKSDKVWVRKVYAGTICKFQALHFKPWAPECNTPRYARQRRQQATMPKLQPDALHFPSRRARTSVDVGTYRVAQLDDVLQNTEF